MINSMKGIQKMKITYLGTAAAEAIPALYCQCAACESARKNLGKEYRCRSGCVIARDNQILVTGYVGSPAGLPHCDEKGHLLKKMLHDDGTISQHCVRTVHAEQNAICQAAKRGISIDGGTVYCKMTPCRTCAMLLINCGIKRIVCEKHYHDEKDSIKMLSEAGIKIEHLEDSVQVYKDM